MFIASHASSVPYADLVIDHSAFEGSQCYRDQMEAEIRVLTGLSIDLSNYRVDRSIGEPIVERADLIEIADVVCSRLEAEYAASVQFARQALGLVR
ncbi:MAG: hypothetical protein WDO73_32245 [Ignavibacteriota bacterium]